MKIDEKCVGCRACVPYCPVGAIFLDGGKAAIDQDECVECGVCRRVDVCPVKAIDMPKESFEYPRAIRMQFSDPGVQHPNLKAWGRGTEEAKTNDVTGKFGRGEFGLLLEFGRPVTGTRISEIEKIAKLIRSMGIPILEDNPLYGLLTEDMSGSFKPEYVNEKILSGILEIRTCTRRKVHISIFAGDIDDRRLRRRPNPLAFHIPGVTTRLKPEPLPGLGNDKTICPTVANILRGAHRNRDFASDKRVVIASGRDRNLARHIAATRRSSDDILVALLHATPSLRHLGVVIAANMAGRITHLFGLPGVEIHRIVAHNGKRREGVLLLAGNEQDGKNYRNKY